MVDFAKKLEEFRCTCGHMRSQHDMGWDSAGCMLCSCGEYTAPAGIKEEHIEVDFSEIESVAKDVAAGISVSALPTYSNLTGSAGTGKSHKIRALDRDSSEVLLCATTGIAAINLGGTTINSVLGYYDLDSLKSAFQIGGVQARLRRHREDGVRVIVLDEMSMLGGEQLTIIKDVFDEVNGGSDPTDDDHMKLMLVGDFAQLPPVKAKFAFEAPCWKEDFEPHTTKLTKIWRQDNPKFIETLNLARVGKGEEAADLLSTLVEWEKTLDNSYDGPTIFAKNEEVDRHNLLRLRALPGDVVKIPSARGGREKGEWKNIPNRIELKVGAPVMVLANARDPETKQFVYVNGDLGHFLEAGPANSITGIPLWCKVSLKRTGRTEFVNPVRRTFSANPQKEEFRLQRKFKILTAQEVEDGVEIASLPNSEIKDRIGEERFKEYLEMLMGWVEYMPLRIAYASTTHKAQGLSLDKAQISISNFFFSNPGSIYVALSRVRTPEGLRLVGSKELFVKRCKVDRKVERFL